MAPQVQLRHSHNLFSSSAGESPHLHHICTLAQPFTWISWKGCDFEKHDEKRKMTRVEFTIEKREDRHFVIESLHHPGSSKPSTVGCFFGRHRFWRRNLQSTAPVKSRGIGYLWFISNLRIYACTDWYSFKSIPLRLRCSLTSSRHL